MQLRTGQGQQRLRLRSDHNQIAAALDRIGCPGLDDGGTWVGSKLREELKAQHSQRATRTITSKIMAEP